MIGKMGRAYRGNGRENKNIYNLGQENLKRT
jgi:hypothetical protein